MRGGKGAGEGKEKYVCLDVQGFRSVCQNVGRANEIRALEVIEYGYVKST